ncbi:helix-turn-helix domain-containing protein [Leucobacter sp. M11]|uniref:helix-turn-helix domain-containing protein n=1 Tax=Leucobacter sp. M11 TaxID=2993565 RepID=UPI002D7EE834|nr:cupin domain-containing protein [Leucobacter sp. M11]MEB4615324.1 cupin domain-containing protein [Leucobacter sp. M11]
MSEEHELGERVAQFRELRGLSLRALAATAGVSSSFLSQLENGKSNASVSSLRKIASALGVTPAALLDASSGHTRGVLRAADRPTLPLDGAQKFVVTQEPLRNLEIYAGHFAPGGNTGPDAYSHGNAQEVFLVVRGSITLELGPERYEMHRGDSIEFLSSVPHRIVNESGADAEVLWINSPPTGEEEAHPALAWERSTRP